MNSGNFAGGLFVYDDMTQRILSIPILPRAVVGLLLTLGVVGGGLAFSELGSGASSPTTPAQQQSTPESGPDPETGADSEDRRFVELRAAYVAPDEVVFDAMELVQGSGEDGDYAVRNPEVENTTLPVAGDVSVSVVDCNESGCEEGKPIDYGSFTRRVEDDTSGPFFWITVRDGQVVAIHEQYLA